MKLLGLLFGTAVPASSTGLVASATASKPNSHCCALRHCRACCCAFRAHHLIPSSSVFGHPSTTIDGVVQPAVRRTIKTNLHRKLSAGQPPPPGQTNPAAATLGTPSFISTSLFHTRTPFSPATMNDGTIMSASDRGLFSFDVLMPMLWKFGTVFFGVAAVAVGLLYAKQDSLLYFPELGDVPRRPGSNPRKYRSPSEHNIPYETHMIRCDDGVSIHSWLLLHPNSLQAKCPTILYFHGNAGNIGLRLPNAIQMYSYLNANVLMVEYRGYGDSENASPSEPGLKLDAEAALRFIATHPSIDPSRIFLFGRSLGGAVAFHLAQYAEHSSDGLSPKIAGVVVENTFISVGRMVDHLMPLVARLKPLVLRIGWDSGVIVPNLQIPILYLAGAKDQLVPHSHMKELYSKSKLARLYVVKNGTHNDTWYIGGAEYWKEFSSFMEEAMSSSTSGAFFRKTIKSDGGWGTSDDTKVAVGMGMDSDAQDGGRGGGNGNSIPITPGSLVGMAREATSSAVSNNTGNKKKQKKDN